MSLKIESQKNCVQAAHQQIGSNQNELLLAKNSQISENQQQLLRTDKLRLQTHQLNTFLKNLVTSKELISSNNKLPEDFLKGLDYQPFRTVIQMTNQSKLFAHIIKQERNIKIEEDQIRPQSAVLFTYLIGMRQKYRQMKCKYHQFFDQLRGIKMENLKKKKKIKDKADYEIQSLRNIISTMKAQAKSLMKDNEDLVNNINEKSLRHIQMLNQQKDALEEEKLKATKQIECLKKEIERILQQKQQNTKDLKDDSFNAKNLLKKATQQLANDIFKIDKMNEKYNQLMKEMKEKDEYYQKEKKKLNDLHFEQLRKCQQRQQQLLQQKQDMLSQIKRQLQENKKVIQQIEQNSKKDATVRNNLEKQIQKLVSQVKQLNNRLKKEAQRSQLLEKQQICKVSPEQEVNNKMIGKLKIFIDQLSKENQGICQRRGQRNQSNNIMKQVNCDKSKSNKQIEALKTSYQQKLSQKQQQIKELLSKYRRYKTLLKQVSSDKLLKEKAIQTLQKNLLLSDQRYDLLVKEHNQKNCINKKILISGQNCKEKQGTTQRLDHKQHPIKEYDLALQQLLQSNNSLREQKAQLHEKFHMFSLNREVFLIQQQQQSFSELPKNQCHASSVK